MQWRSCFYTFGRNQRVAEMGNSCGTFFPPLFYVAFRCAVCSKARLSVGVRSQAAVSYTPVCRRSVRNRRCILRRLGNRDCEGAKTKSAVTKRYTLRTHEIESD